VARGVTPQNQAMVQPDDPLELDSDVEPLFAGLAGAERKKDAAQDSADSPEPDLWHNSRRVFEPDAAQKPASADEEPSTARLLIKAILVLIALVLAGAFVYLAVGV
jgi:hypothetical protein